MQLNECYSMKKWYLKQMLSMKKRIFPIDKNNSMSRAMTFMNLFVGTQLQHKKKFMKIKENQQTKVSNTLQAVLKTRKMNFVHKLLIDLLPHLHKIMGSISRSIKTNKLNRNSKRWQRNRYTKVQKIYIYTYIVSASMYEYVLFYVYIHIYEYSKINTFLQLNIHCELVWNTVLFALSANLSSSYHFLLYS